MYEMAFSPDFLIGDIIYLKTDKDFKRPFKVIGYLIDETTNFYYHCRNEYLDDYYSQIEIYNNNLN